MMTAKPHKIAIVDDYQQVALKSGDWSKVLPVADITVYTDTLHSEDSLSERLLPYDIICTMRERTKFPRSLLARLPKLKLLTTTGMRNLSIDVKAANEGGVTVVGTGFAGNPTLEHTWALILGITRHISEEDRATKEGSEIWQRSIPMGLHGRTMGLIGLGHLGSAIAKYSGLIRMD
jgi:phosphoglycerate dehydrogenase-like enzyme